MPRAASLLAPLGRRVHSVVNYERSTCDEDVFDEDVDLVQPVCAREGEARGDTITLS